MRGSRVECVIGDAFCTNFHTHATNKLVIQRESAYCQTLHYKNMLRREAQHYTVGPEQFPPALQPPSQY